MTKFKALQSDKQFCSVRGQRLKAVGGFLTTEDKVVIKALSESPAWELVEGEKAPAKEDVPKKAVKKGSK
jgi:hypothetical protein